MVESQMTRAVLPSVREASAAATVRRQPIWHQSDRFLRDTFCLGS